MPKYEPVKLLPEKTEYVPAGNGAWRPAGKSAEPYVSQELRQRCIDMAIRIGNFDNSVDRVIEDAIKIENYLRGTSADL